MPWGAGEESRPGKNLWRDEKEEPLLYSSGIRPGPQVKEEA